MDKIIKQLFTTSTMTKILNQTKVDPTFVMNNYFSSKQAMLGSTVQIPIKKGSGLVLESVSPNAAHMFIDNGEAFILTIELPRFPLKSHITASDLNEFKSLQGQEQVQAVSTFIGQKLNEHKSSLVTTLEHMAAGALFGKVQDGRCHTLFEFKNNKKEVEFATGKKIVQCLNQIDAFLEDELGTEAPYEVLASRGFIGKLGDLAATEKMFEKGQARWVQDGNKRTLEVLGKRFVPYGASYKNTRGITKHFIEANKAVVTPKISNAYKLYYGRANHVEALNKAPSFMFSAMPEKLPNGAGYAIISEMRALPAFLRPDAAIDLKWAN